MPGQGTLQNQGMQQAVVGDEVGDGMTADEFRGLKGPATEGVIVLSLISFQDRKSPSPVPSKALPEPGSFPATCSATICLPLYQYPTGKQRTMTYMTLSVRNFFRALCTEGTLSFMVKSKLIRFTHLTNSQIVSHC